MTFVLSLFRQPETLWRQYAPIYGLPRTNKIFHYKLRDGINGSHYCFRDGRQISSVHFENNAEAETTLMARFKEEQLLLLLLRLLLLDLQRKWKLFQEHSADFQLYVTWRKPFRFKRNRGCNEHVVDHTKFPEANKHITVMDISLPQQIRYT